MSKKHLEFYYKCMEDGRMPDYGLCHCANSLLIDEEILELFEPSNDERFELLTEGYSALFWASGSRYRCYKQFTPLRQNIVLLMAAMNGELDNIK